MVVRNVLGGSFALSAALIIAVAGSVVMAVTAAEDDLSQDFNIIFANIRLQQDLKDPNKRMFERFLSKTRILGLFHFHRIPFPSI